MKAEKDARDGQDLAMARQRQSEQVRQNILMREQTQRVATIPVRNLLLSIRSMFMVSQTAPAQQPQQSTSQSQPQQAQQLQQPLAQQQLQHQHTQIPQLHQIQAQQQAIQSQRPTGAPSAIPNRSARLSTAVNARPLSQQGQHLQQGRGVQVSVPLQAGAQANTVSFPILKLLYLSIDYCHGTISIDSSSDKAFWSGPNFGPCSTFNSITNGLPQAVAAESSYPTPKQWQYILWITTKFYSRTG
jgi:hypothetical protein